MKHRYTSHGKINEEHKAVLFCTLMLCLVTFSFFFALTSSGPIVLGTEMNTNGMVEYLCLGTDCNNIF